ncbi:MAG TPA: AAA family ATPase [Saprospiraceae bacterium]|nr:AAA family ATPase [Saprospiraceae bacterium]
MEKTPLELNGDFEYVLEVLEKTNKSMFVTGRAGTGKSTLLQLFRNTTRKNTVVLAPTGIAALNIQGQTIHSFFGFPPKPISKTDIKKRRARKLYEKIEVLIIDEISMVRADMLDNIDYFLRLNRENPNPFGGVQMVFFGDLFQLPPIVSTEAEKMLFKTYYDSPFFFSAKVIEAGCFDLEMVELRKVYRQEARFFIRLLDAIRTNQWDYDDLEDINQQYKPYFKPSENYITLSTRNSIVDAINAKALQKLLTPEFSFIATVTGSFNPRLFPTDAVLKLKEGAQVMFIKNDPQRKFVNGTIGKVISIRNDYIKVLIEEGEKSRSVEVEKMEWEVLKYISNTEKNKIETEVVGTFQQYPLRLAWAITIHKSQGKTFDKIIIDLGRGAFEHGQSYVALSRCRSLEGIVLKQKLKAQDIMVNEKIIEFYESNL